MDIRDIQPQAAPLPAVDLAANDQIAPAAEQPEPSPPAPVEVEPASVVAAPAEEHLGNTVDARV